MDCQCGVLVPLTKSEQIKAESQLNKDKVGRRYAGGGARPSL